MRVLRLPLGLSCALGVLLASCLPTLDGADGDLSGQEVRLTLLHTSDIHSRIIPFDFAPLKTDVDLGLIPEAGPFGGAARMASLIKRERARADRTLHLDSGDCFQGAPIFNLNTGEAEFRFLSEVGLDAAVVGNHEFDAGARNFANMARDFARFPLLSANYIWEDPKQPGSHQSALYTEPYVIRNVQGLRVGVIGMANISSLNSIVEGGNSMQVTPLEQNEVVRGYVEMLRPVTDLIVITSHLGLHEDQELVRGYEAYYEYGRIKHFVKERKYDRWQVLEWFGPENADSSVVRVLIPGVSGIDVIMGGHLHVVLNPPQTLKDPSGRDVLLAHSGAFAKYLGRLDLVVKMPEAGADAPEGGEVVSHDYRVFPIDSLWCNEAMHRLYDERFWAAGEFRADPGVQAAMNECALTEDPRITELLRPYVVDMDFDLRLTNVFAYAPRDVTRRNNSTGGDAPLGNMAADSMRTRQRVEAEFALTNTLGIRDNLYAGPVTDEAMFNVFPFENTINVMYLSGREVQEMLDFVTERSSGRGCQSQAQVSGVRFTMDCAQVQLNDILYACDLMKQGTDCPQENRDERAPWTCVKSETDPGAGRCWAHPAWNIHIQDKPLDPNATYKVAVNDYIAKGGSGFAVLKRNTTRIETGISLRDSLIGYMQNFCTCEDLNAGRERSQSGHRCAVFKDGEYVVDEQAKAYCVRAKEFEEAIHAKAGGCTCRDVLAKDSSRCGELTDEMLSQCVAVPEGPGLGGCSCKQALSKNTAACGSVTRQVENFCVHPTSFALTVGYEDGRIRRRVK